MLFDLFSMWLPRYQTAIKVSEEVTIDNSKDDGVVEYQSCASISSDIDGDR